MERFSILTTFRPDIGVAGIPISFRGQFVSIGVLLKEGIFSYELADKELIALINPGEARVTVNETDGHYHAEIHVHNPAP